MQTMLWTNVRVAAVAVAVTMVLDCLAVAKEPTAAELTKERKGPLRSLPGPLGPHLARIKVLGDNSWLSLGSPKPDPKWGKAPGRSWGAKMAYAADLRGAFLYGEGVHGYVKPDGHYMDDCWFYDINAHRWMCIYPGADVNALALEINDDGFEVDKDGQPIPVAQMVHGYEALTYDTDLKKFMFVSCEHSYWKKHLARRSKWLKPLTAHAGPWFYDTAAGRWERHRLTAPGAPQHSYGSVLIYLSSKKQSFLYYRGGAVWFYDHVAKRWINAPVKGPNPPFGIDGTACYDSKRERIYIGGGNYPIAPTPNALWIYELSTNTWINPNPKGSRMRHYGTNVATMHYDSANDVVVLIMHEKKRESRGVNIYDPKTNAWNEAPLALPAEVPGQCWNAFYDPELNLHFFHLARDSTPDGVIWVYRYKRAKKDRG